MGTIRKVMAVSLLVASIGACGATAPPSRPAEYAVPGHVDAAVVRDLGAWVRALP